MTRQTIPVVDLHDFVGGDGRARARFVTAVGDALRDVGFFALVNHGITDAMVARVYELAEAFFALDPAQKQRYERPAVMGQRGYVSFGREHAKDAQAPDLKEYWSLGPEGVEHPYPENVWPDEVPGLRAATLALYDALGACAQTLLRACALYLGEAETRLSSMAKEGDTLLRVIHYPPTPDGADAAAMRAAPHEDVNFLTLLVGATEPGLELLQRDGSWLPVAAVPGQVIVDSGDMMQHLTAGYLKSTTHQVVNVGADRGRRFSMPYFVHPRPDVDLTPLASCVERVGETRFGPTTAGEFLRRRLHEIGLKPTVA